MNFTKTIFVIAFFIQRNRDFLINQLLFYFKAKDKPDLQNKSSKRFKKRKKIEGQRNHHSPSLVGYNVWLAITSYNEKNGADYPFQHVKEEIKKADYFFCEF